MTTSVLFFVSGPLSELTFGCLNKRKRFLRTNKCSGLQSTRLMKNADKSTSKFSQVICALSCWLTLTGERCFERGTSATAMYGVHPNAKNLIDHQAVSHNPGNKTEQPSPHLEVPFCFQPAGSSHLFNQQIQVDSASAVKFLRAQTDVLDLHVRKNFELAFHAQAVSDL